MSLCRIVASLVTLGLVIPSDVSSSLLLADEGMWLFNDLPAQYLQEKYGFTPTTEWARRLMLSSVRFNSGGSASFVSSKGLVLTNHHVGADTLHKISTPENNYYRDGFYATVVRRRDQGPRFGAESTDLDRGCHAARARCRQQRYGGVAGSRGARRAVMADIEKESQTQTGLRSDVVTLYGGGRYHLYRYKKFTDVRLVWAPEAAIAFFGGDADNFEYPRYNLDACLFRVYEDDHPAQIEHFLSWSDRGRPGR